MSIEIIFQRENKQKKKLKEYQEAAEKYLLRNSVYSREEVRTVLKEIFDDNTGLKSAHSTAEFLQLLNQFPSENSKRMVEEEQEFFEDLIADLKKILCIENIMCDDNTVAFSLNKGQLPHIFGNNEVTDQENLELGIGPAPDELQITNATYN